MAKKLELPDVHIPKVNLYPLVSAPILQISVFHTVYSGVFIILFHVFHILVLFVHDFAV